MTYPTTTTLLDGLRDPEDRDRWSSFDARFRPVLFAMARRLGLSHEDAADAAQESLVRFVRAYRDGRYDRSKGRLSSWLAGITRNCVRDALSRRRPARGGSALADIEDDGQLERTWIAARDDTILRDAVDRLRERSKGDPQALRAFESLLRGRSAPATARELGMSLNEVYLAKHRCLRAVRAIVERLREAFDE